MTTRTYNVLFLCKGNSARSIIAEAYLNSKNSHLRGFSAGASPLGRIHPLALQVVRDLGVATDGLRSKNWSEFTQAGAPLMDLVINLCDEPAGEKCPVLPGEPVTAQWAIPDPSAASGVGWEQTRAFVTAAGYLRRRIDILLNFRMEMLDKLAVARLNAIGEWHKQDHRDALSPR